MQLTIVQRILTINDVERLLNRSALAYSCDLFVKDDPYFSWEREAFAGMDSVSAKGR